RALSALHVPAGGGGGRGARTPSRADCLRPGHRECRWTPVGAHAAAQGRGLARLRVLHELRGPKGPRAWRATRGGDVFPLAAAGGAGSSGGIGITRERSRVGCLLRHSSKRQPARSLGVGAEPRATGRRRLRKTPRRSRAAFRRWPGGTPAALGRLPARSRTDRVLAKSSESMARARALRARGERLAGDATLSLTCARPSTREPMIRQADDPASG